MTEGMITENTALANNNKKKKRGRWGYEKKKKELPSNCFESVIEYNHTEIRVIVVCECWNNNAIRWNERQNGE